MPRIDPNQALLRALFDLSPDAVLIIDPHDPDVSWPIIDCNIAACVMNGFSDEELIGNSIDILNLTPGTEAERRAYLEQLRKTGRIEIETYHRRKNGETFPVEVSTSIISIDNRELVIGIDRDITERRKAEEALRQSEERFKLMAWATKDAVWDWDIQSDKIWWGEGLQKIFHYSSEIAETNSEWWFAHIHGEDVVKVNRTIQQAIDGGMEFWSKEYRFQRKDGTYAEIMDRGYIIRDNIGNATRMIGAMLDITERRQMEFSLLQANEQMRQFLNALEEHNREITLLYELSRLLQACESEIEAYEIMADVSRQLFPRTTGVLYRIDSSNTLLGAVAGWGEVPFVERLYTLHDCWALRHGEAHLIDQDHPAPICVHVSEPLPAVSYCIPLQALGEVVGVLHVQSQQAENLGEPKRQLANTVVEQTLLILSNLKLREALREQSVRDSLTGLYNRRYMEATLKQQLSRVTRSMHLLGIIMIDIDYFKQFNDRHGHAAGDALLHELGQSFQSNIRDEDIACRYGGEEFLLIMPDASLEVVQSRAEHVLEQARQLKIQHQERHGEGITLSLGVAMYPTHGHTIEIVLRAADTALYRAKQEGRNRVVIAEKE